MNDTALDRKPYLLTAYHCGIRPANAASVVVYWNFQNSFCRTPNSLQSAKAGNGKLSQFQTGSTFRAGYRPSDFTLIQLDDAPSPVFNVFFAGWDRSSHNYPNSEGIHHPSLAEKRISLSHLPTTTTSVNDPQVPGDGTHIHVRWSLGVTEVGSSGSPLYNGMGRLIGQLDDGPSSCTATDKSDYYGRFSVSWTGGGKRVNRLKDWLDPGNTQKVRINGVN